MLQEINFKIHNSGATPRAKKKQHPDVLFYTQMHVFIRTILYRRIVFLQQKALRASGPHIVSFSHPCARIKSGPARAAAAMTAMLHFIQIKIYSASPTDLSLPSIIKFERQ